MEALKYISEFCLGLGLAFFTVRLMNYLFTKDRNLIRYIELAAELQQDVDEFRRRVRFLEQENKQLRKLIKGNIVK